MISPSDYEYLIYGDDDDNTPVTIPTTWPRSSDNLYSPPLESVNKAIISLNEYKPHISTALIYDSEQAFREGIDPSVKYDKSFWRRVRLQEDTTNYIKRLKRRHIKHVKKGRIFKEARLLAFNYYMCQKMHAFGILRQSFLSHIETVWKYIFQKQLNERRFFNKNLLIEDHSISKLYEDYYQPINNKTKLKKHPMFHENTYKHLFQRELRRRILRVKELFLAKQKTERRLQFLWSLDYHVLTMKEKEILYRAQQNLKNDIYVRNFR